MNRRGVLVLALGATLAGCERLSRANPFRRRGPPPPLDAAGVPVDPRPTMDQVTRLAVEPVTGGAIVRATGIPPVQGFWDGALIGDGLPRQGVLAFRFVAVPPPDPARVSTPASRAVVVGRFIPDDVLSATRTVVVEAARNQATVRR